MDARIYCMVLVNILVLQCIPIKSLVLPRSPCPHVFTYNTSSTQSDRWYGEILVHADTTLSGFWIDVELDRPAQLLGNYLAEVTSSNNQEFKIQDLDRRLDRGSVTPVQIYVKFSEVEPLPKLSVIRLNGRQICPIEGEENDPDGLMEPMTSYNRDRETPQAGTQFRGGNQSQRGTNAGVVFEGSAMNTGYSSRNGSNSEPTYRRTTTPPRTQTSFVGGNRRTDQPRTTQSTRKTDYDRVTQPTRASNPTRPTTAPVRNTQTERDRVNQSGFQGSSFQSGGSQSARPQSNRDQANWNVAVDQGTQTHRDESTENHRGTEFGSQPSRGTQTNRRDENPPRGDDTNRGSEFSSGGGSNSDFKPQRGNEQPQRGSDPQRVNEPSRGSGSSTWEETPQRGTQTQTQHGSGSNDYNRGQNSQGTTVYTSLDEVRPIQRPVYTTERYEPKPITPNPQNNVRPGHTPLSNSNARPAEPSSSDYYEWGVRRTTKRTKLSTPPPRDNHQIVDEQCGKVAIRPVALISRGTPTKTGEYPWHAAIYRPEGIDLRYICGATLVSLSTLVTAAHCVTRQSTGRAVKPDSLVIYLGKHSLRRWTGNEQTATVSEILVHPAYNHTAFQADIALLKLSTPVTYNDYVRPVCLWDSRRSSIESVVARRGTVVGWGYDEYQVVTDELMQAQMPVVTKLDCIHSFPTFFSRFVTDLTYCAGFRNGTTACNGDSGGGMVFQEEPLDFNEDRVWRLRGVVSIGVSITDQFVCDYNHYIVFTDVAQFLPWLEANI